MTARQYSLPTMALLVAFVLLVTAATGAAESTGRFTLGQIITNPQTLEMSNKEILQQGSKLPTRRAGLNPYRRYSPTQTEREIIFNQNRHWLTGRVYDPLTGREIRVTDKWDAGHKPGHEFWRAKEDAIRRSKSSLQFRLEQRNPGIYHPELVSSNRSRRYEMPRTNTAARSTSSIAAKTLGRALGGAGVVFSAHEFYDTERRYRSGELSAAVRSREHIVTGSATAAGIALLLAPEPVISTLAGGVILVSVADDHLPLALREHGQKHHDALLRKSEQLDRAMEDIIRRREERIVDQSHRKEADRMRKSIRIQLVANDVRRMIDQH